MNFKKITAFFILIFSLFILISCGPKEETEDPDEKVTLTYQGTSLETGIIGITYSQNIAIATGSDNITYALKQGSTLPEGLELVGPLVYGIPTLVESSEFIIVADADDAKAPVEATFTIVINEPIDTEKPNIIGTSNITIVNGDPKPNWLDGISATDNVDETVTVTVDDSAVMLTTAGTYDLIYEAVDEAGNTRTVTVTVTILDPADTLAPIISGTNNFNLELGDEVPNWLEGVTAVDDVDGTVAVTVDDSAVNLEAEGTYDLIYRATDQEDNVRTVTVTVTVVKPEPVLKTYKYEAEYIDFTGISGSGWSNTQTEWGMVVGDGTSNTATSNGMYVAYFTPPYATLTFEFTADEAGTGKLIFSMTSEYVMDFGGVELMLLNPDIMTLTINGVEMDYEIPVFGESQPNIDFQEYVFFDSFDIKEGVNTISLTMLENQYFPGRPGGGPNVDYMIIESFVDIEMNQYCDTVEEVILLRGF